MCEKNDIFWEILGVVCEDVIIVEFVGFVKYVYIYDGVLDKIFNGIFKDFFFFGI